MAKSDRPLDPDVAQEVTDSIARGYEFLKLKDGEVSPEEVQEAIYKAIDRLRGKPSGLTEERITELSVCLGCVWGDTVCRVLNWEWCVATLEGGDHFGIVTPNRSHVIFPMYFIQEQLKKDAEEDNTSLLLFNMLVAGQLPKAQPRSYTVLG